MSKYSFSRLNPINFLQTFVTQSLELSQQCRPDNDDEQINKIEKLGLSAGACFESVYREERGLIGLLDQAQYRDLIVEIKNQIGGCFSPASSESGTVRVINTRCPFGEAVKHAPELCRMTSSVFGGIAAHNFGYAKVVLNKRIAVGDGMCDVCVHTDPNEAGQYPGGDEYRKKGEVIVGKAASADVSARVEKQLSKVWFDIKSNPADKPRVVAQSTSMRQVLESVEIIAPTTANVLITGETGVGKEVIARAVHAMSERWNNKFLAINCGAIPENLVESVLFGHERGAFTGAYEVHQGYFERANNSTLFLDEIDSLPLLSQARLLRVLQENEFERVGGRQSLVANVRVIAAASSQFDKLVAQGDFRRDLYYRLSVVPIYIPPLRERPEDISPLAVSILARLSEKYRKKPNKLGSRALEQLISYDWPGNVRELENILERSFLFASGEVLEQVALPRKLGKAKSILTSISAHDAPYTLKEAKKKAADEVEKAMLEELLAYSRGNIKEVAQSLQITPRAVHQKLTQHQIDPNAFRHFP
ncbi:sigma 54-interacting transcriptional regulator [Nitrosomonas marina]|uniref:Nif-specific regulatory protein/two-component system, NtrC family, response regulator AtoC n=1 Tax=Nitrosomonas marina TaxID=917 RepID=A0A1H8IGF5_9PROT|nr:sigma 54-interacting transcriptional regulator [Nitrosomonas marina]SEN67441.1 Nif-specific regulatory protein/two-component system, NtrC family, response regulator AtoC [Nitrosomonas marina]